MLLTRKHIQISMCNRFSRLRDKHHAGPRDTTRCALRRAFQWCALEILRTIINFYVLRVPLQSPCKIISENLPTFVTLRQIYCYNNLVDVPIILESNSVMSCLWLEQFADLYASPWSYFQCFGSLALVLVTANVFQNLVKYFFRLYI